MTDMQIGQQQARQSDGNLSASGTTPTDSVHQFAQFKAEKELERDASNNTTTSTVVNSSATDNGGYKSATDWTGPDDPGNPQNWSMRKKVYHSAVTAILSFAVTYGSSSYSPGIGKVAEELDVSQPVAVLGLSLYVLGLGLGPMMSGGLSETYGRKAVYVYLTPISLLFTLGAGLSKNITSLLVCRFLAGAIGAGPLAVGAGTNTDIWAPVDRAAAVSIWILSPFLGPALGPATASYPIQDLTWRWGQWLILIVGGVAYLFSLFQEETYKKAILKARAKKYNLPPPHDPLPPGFAKVKAILNLTCVRALRMLLTEPICFLFSLYSAFTFGVLFAFFTAAVYVFRTVYHFTIGESGLVFIALGIGSILSTGIFIIIDRFTYRRKLLLRISKGDNRPLPPEERLYAAMLGALLVPPSLFWFGWTAREDIHWIVPTISLGLFAAGNLLVFDTTAIYLADTYGMHGAASSASANSFARYVTGGVFPLFAVPMFEHLSIPWAGSLLGFVTLAMMPIPFMFFRFGKRIRSRGSIPKSGA